MQATFHIKRERICHFHIENYQRLNGDSFHFHSHIELLLVRGGEAEVWINDERATVCQNELAVVLGYEAHHFRSVREGEYTILFIPAFLCPDFVDAVRNKKAYRPVIRDKNAMMRICEAVRMLSEGALNAVERTGYIHVILGTVLRQIELGALGKPQDTDLPAKLLFYINEHYKENISTATVARALGYSQNYISKCFRACFQIGINRYINTMRLKNAVTLLREKKTSITDCALESGFASLRTFYRAFAEEFGCAPRDYLKQG
ncbi:MAG: helix-turn-helix transcriptional regulator [Ruminococcaceae bacterium]|nr:helix-turn-helix transcriptional regulator [Oscillospiraceae bacterium]